MKLVGLTGGIGSGKSTVASLLRVMGYPVYNSDDRARYLQSNDQELIDETVNLLGEEVLDNGRLNRALIAEKVFGNPELLKKLNALVHPRVKEDFLNWRNGLNAQIVFKESALLIETGSHSECDYVVIVSAPEDVRIERVVLRDETGRRDILQRMKHQMPEDEKLGVADFIVQNDGRIAIIPQVEHILEQIK
jgi:dephospho-CoA kinase